MATDYYLLSHPNPNCPERGDGRYWGYAEMSAAPIWVTVHTTESFADVIDGDMGAENVANYFATGAVAASYHTLVDSDSTVDCLPAGLDGTTVHTAFHVYQRNTRNLGVSLAMRAQEWATIPGPWAARILDRAADRAAAWCLQHRIPPEIRTLADVEAGIPGITGHGIIQPLDRSDPGALFPWQRFIELVRVRVSGGTAPTPPSEEDDMIRVFQASSGQTVLLDGVTYRVVNRPWGDVVAGLLDLESKGIVAPIGRNQQGWLLIPAISDSALALFKEV